MGRWQRGLYPSCQLIVEGPGVLRIAHVVNPVIAGPSSDLRIAQPVTFESMRVAAECAAEPVQVDLISAQFAEDRAAVPGFFRLSSDLDRSALDVGTFAVPRRLPLLGDIFGRLAEAAPQADIYIYTNVDIAVVPHFYVSVAALMQDADALIINRRTIPAHFHNMDQLPLMYADVGKRHPGYDCFVFRSELLARLELGDMVIGAPWIGNGMLANLACLAREFSLLKDLHLTFHIGDDRSWLRPELIDYRVHNRRQLLNILMSWSSVGLLQRSPIAQGVLRAAQAEEAGNARRLRREVRRLAGVAKVRARKLSGRGDRATEGDRLS